MTVAFVVCVSDMSKLRRYLFSSPGLPKEWEKRIFLMHDCRSAAEGFNAALAIARCDWLVFVHQDVVLPPGWFTGFVNRLNEAEKAFPLLTVVGVYGKFTEPNGLVCSLGEVVDRGQPLKEDTPLPHAANSLDELLFAVRRDSGLMLDARLGFHLYATDVALTALSRSQQVAVIHAPCAHCSSLPFDPTQAPQQTIDGFIASARIFADKWADRLPLATPSWFFAEPAILPTVEGIRGAHGF